MSHSKRPFSFFGGGSSKGKQKVEESDGSAVVVFNMDIHCEGCETKIRRAIKKFNGVEKVSVDVDTGTIKVTGQVDPNMIKEKLEKKFKTRVEIVSEVQKEEKSERSDPAPDNNMGYNPNSYMNYPMGDNQNSSMNFNMGGHHDSSMNFDTEMFNDDNTNACVLM